MKKCRPVVKGPSGGTLLFCFALPARGASVTGANGGLTMALCLGAACTGCIDRWDWSLPSPYLCLGAACTGCIRTASVEALSGANFASALPARGASDARMVGLDFRVGFASALPARGASDSTTEKPWTDNFASALPARGASVGQTVKVKAVDTFASALPARGASAGHLYRYSCLQLCLGAACTGCI